MDNSKYLRDDDVKMELMTYNCDDCFVVRDKMILKLLSYTLLFFLCISI